VLTSILESRRKKSSSQSALIADRQGTYVFAVEDGKAVIRRVKPGGQIGVNVAVESGLKAGEQVIR
jgi:membrane fusion protein, multidrug efflux system